MSDPNQAGDGTQPGKEGASPDGNLIAKIKKLEGENRTMRGQLDEESGKRRTAEEATEWAKTLSGDVPEEIRNQIFSANLEVSKRSSDIDARETAVKASELVVESSKLVAEHGIEATVLEGIGTVEEMKVAALTAANTRMAEEIEAAKKVTPGAFEFGTALSSGGSPKDMTDEQFTAYIVQQKAEAAAKVLQR